GPPRGCGKRHWIEEPGAGMEPQAARRPQRSAAEGVAGGRHLVETKFSSQLRAGQSGRRQARLSDSEPRSGRAGRRTACVRSRRQGTSRAVLVVDNPGFSPAVRAQILDFAMKRRLPVISQYKHFAEARSEGGTTTDDVLS